MWENVFVVHVTWLNTNIHITMYILEYVKLSQIDTLSHVIP